MLKGPDMIPFLDLLMPHEELEEELVSVFRTALRHGRFSGGPNPIPVHLQEAYAWLGYAPGDLPVAERVATEVLSLPMYPQLTCAQQERVIEALRDHLQASASLRVAGVAA